MNQFSTPRAWIRRWEWWMICGVLALAPVTVRAAKQKADQAQTQPAPAEAKEQAPAQPGQAPTDVNTPTIKLNVNEVELIFTVTDKRGRYIPNLTQSDFTLLDDQRAPQKVTSFHQQINLPLRVGMLIDTSTSIRSRFQFEQQAAIGFLLQILKPRSDRAFVMGFDVTPTVAASWTNDLDALERGINGLRAGGGTALYDAVYSACRYDLLNESRGQEPVRKAMILISDGNDDQSRVYLSEAIKECERADTIIYAVSTNWTPSRGPGDKVMTELAEDTGGEAFFPSMMEDMTKSFTSIATELRSQYALTYTPADFKYDGSFHTIYLYCYNRSYHVHVSRGYYAPAAESAN